MADAGGDDPAFAIPDHPQRRYPEGGGVEYEGTVVFTLAPAEERSDADLAALVETVLERPPYQYGDWFELPMPLYLVHDDDTGDTFRVAVRDGAVEFHVLPETESAGLRGLYERLADASDTTWSVTCRSSE